MTAAPYPENESERLKALQNYNILDTLPEQAYDEIAHCASLICDTPVALITLIDHDRQWFKAKVGLATPETSREYSFCAHTILKPGEVMIVNDASHDNRFASNPLVTGEPHIRFYAGAPLIAPTGEALGSVCVIDRIPRELTPRQIEMLQALSRQVINQLELRQSIRQLEQIVLEQEQHTHQLKDYQQTLENALVKMEEQSLRDGLTDVYNRRAFQIHLRDEFNNASQFHRHLALLMLDIDHFKEYNDQFGHPAGDTVLQMVAKVLQENSREHDFVARYGGEEFAIILLNTTREMALVIGERFRRSIQQASWLLRSVTISIGIATLAAAMTSSDELLIQADKALYHAKESGRNRISYLQNSNHIHP